MKSYTLLSQNPNEKEKQNILSLYLTVRGQTIEQTQSGLDL